METVAQTVAQAKAAVLGGNTTVPQNEEPPAAQTGQGTINSPYDQGNQPEQSSVNTTAAPSGNALKNEEPPSGQTGSGTVDSPYDQGNEPEQSSTTTATVNSGAPGTEEPPSGQAGAGTASSPYDQGNQPEQSEIPTIVSPSKEVDTASSSSSGTPRQPDPSDPLASPSTTHQGSGNPTSQPTPEQEQVIHESRGRIETAQRTTSTMLSPTSAKTTGTAAQGGNFDAAKPGAGLEANRLRYERSVSPGQLADGTHVQCSGDRGQSYTPGNKFADKLKDRFHFGSKKN